MRLVPYIFLIFIFLYNVGFAYSFAELQEKVEAGLEHDYQLDNIIVKITPPSLLKNSLDIHLKEVYREPNSNKVKIIFTSEGLEYSAEGIIIEAVNLPILRHKVSKGEIITQDMLEELKYPKDKFSNFMIKDENNITGKSAKRTLQPNKPIKFSDLMSPVVINKGQKVTLQFNKNSLIIETLGVALEPGGLGDTIKLKNIDSGKIVIGRVKDHEMVEVRGKM